MGTISEISNFGVRIIAESNSYSSIDRSSPDDYASRGYDDRDSVERSYDPIVSVSLGGKIHSSKR